MPDEPVGDSPRARPRKFAEDFAAKWSQASITGRSRSPEEIDRAIAANREDPALHFERGVALADLGRLEDALDSFHDVIRLDPDFPRVWAARARVLLLLGRGGSPPPEDVLDSESHGEALRPIPRRILAPIHDLERELRELEKRAEPTRSADPELDARLARWRKQGFDVEPIQRALLSDPAVARSLAGTFEENLPRLRELRREVEDLVLPGRREEFEALLRSMRQPLDIDRYEEEVLALLRSADEAPGPEPPRPAPEAPGRQPARSPGPVGLEARTDLSEKTGRTNGLTNGLRGHTNGLTNGLRGRTNGLVNGLRGRTNGLTNGVRGRTNGLVNGTRGRTNGLVNGLRGRVNGLTNGLVNGNRGRTNGLVNGTRGRTNGLVNGTRGRTNGVTNGLTNGLRSAKLGITNGLTNGMGLTNGLGSVRHGRDRRFAWWKVYLVPLIAITLLAVPFFTPPNAPPGLYGVTVDGSLGDWAGLSASILPHTRAAVPSSTDVIETGIVEDQESLALYIRVSGSLALAGDVALQGPDTLRVYLDTDRDPATGYRVEGTGADLLVEVVGFGGSLRSATLLRHRTPANWYDWNEWEGAGAVPAAVRADVVELLLDRDLLVPGVPPEVVVRSQAADGSLDSADAVISPEPGALIATSRSLAPAVVPRLVPTDLLELALSARGAAVTVRQVRLALLGTVSETAISAVAPPTLTRTGGGSFTGTVSGPTLLFDLDQTFAAGETAVFTAALRLDGGDGSSVGLGVESPRDIDLDQGAVTLVEAPSARGLGTIGAPTPAAVIDGGFAEWNETALPAGDASTMGNADIDLVGAATRADASSAYAYVHVAGRLFAGAKIPLRPLRYTPAGEADSDRDTMPDAVDPFPRDFDNDGIEDTATPNDVDGDGLLDYPAGTDLTLQMTIGAKWSDPSVFPPGFLGRQVSLYIGPVAKTPVIGGDTLRVYYDADPAAGGGFAVGSILADYMVELVGREGWVIPGGARVFAFPPTAAPYDWSAWAYLGPAAFAKDLSRVELRATLGVALDANTTAVYMELVDWQGGSDSDQAPLGTRSASAPGTRGSIIVVPLFSGTGDHKFVVTGTGDYRLNDEFKKISMRFTARASVTATDIRVYVSAATPGGQATWNLELRSNSGGNPDEAAAALCTGTISPTAAGWVSVACTASITSGTVYHVYVAFSGSGTKPNAGKYIDIRYTTPNNQKQVYDGATDSNTNVLTCGASGCSWSAVNAQPVFLVNHATQVNGNPFYTYSEVTIYGATGRGNKFSVSANNNYVKAEFYVKKVGSPTGNLFFILRQVGGSELVNVSVAASAVSTSYAWISFTFSSTALSTGNTYAAYLQAPSGTDASNYFAVSVNQADSASPYPSFTFDGTTTFRTDVTLGTPSFGDTTNHDIPFALHIPEFEGPAAVVAVLGMVALVFSRRRARRGSPASARASRSAGSSSP